jgi:hypothetical protein
MQKLGWLAGLSFFLFSAVAANAAGDNVVVIAVGKVDVPARLPGVCDVTGKISQVWDGKGFHVGDAISLKVPCRGNDASLIPAVATKGPAGPRFIAADILRNSHQGFARLDDTGAVIWDYSNRPYGAWGLAGGYRVMDGMVVPATPGH